MSKLKDAGQFVRLYWRIILACVIAGGGVAVLLASFFIETEQDRVAEVLDQMEESLEEGQVDRFLTHIAPDYAYQGLDKRTIGKLARATIDRFGPPSIWVRSNNFNVRKGLATVKVNIVARSTKRGFEMRAMSRSEWEVSLIKRGDKWYVRQITPLSFNGRNVTNMRSLASFANRLWKQDSTGALP